MKYHLAHLFAERVREQPSRECLIQGSRRLTYEQVDAAATALAASMSGLGVELGDRVAVDLPNEPEWVITLLAAAKLGAVVVPLNPSLGYRELSYQLRHAEVCLAVASNAVGDVDPGLELESIRGTRTE